MNRFLKYLAVLVSAIAVTDVASAQYVIRPTYDGGTYVFSGSSYMVYPNNPSLRWVSPPMEVYSMPTRYSSPNAIYQYPTYYSQYPIYAPNYSNYDVGVGTLYGRTYYNGNWRR